MFSIHAFPMSHICVIVAHIAFKVILAMQELIQSRTLSISMNWSGGVHNPQKKEESLKIFMNSSMSLKFSEKLFIYI